MAEGPPILRGGDSFFVTGRTINKHLFAIISDPAQNSDEIVCVNVTTFRDYEPGRQNRLNDPYSDDSCMLHPGDHPFIVRQSCVNYSAAKSISSADYAELWTKGQIVPDVPFAPNVLGRIRMGLINSPHSRQNHRDILIRQNLI